MRIVLISLALLLFAGLTVAGGCGNCAGCDGGSSCLRPYDSR